ncbi:MAG: rhomboid family intramembrane serine protease [Bacteroidota bacterium]
MLPLRDTIPSKRVPLVNWSLIGLNALAFLYQLQLSPEEMMALYAQYAVIPGNYLESGTGLVGGFSVGALIPFVSCMFLHGGWGHILGNMLTLYIFGDNVEDRMGHANYLLFYLLCGFAASATHVALNASSPIPVIGASGAISGVMAAYMFLYPQSKILMLFPIVIIPFFFHIRAYLYLGFWFLLQLYNGFSDLTGPESNGGVAFFAHVGGFVAGMILFKPFLDRKYKKEVRLESMRKKYPQHISYENDRYYGRNTWR